MKNRYVRKIRLWGVFCVFLYTNGLGAEVSPDPSPSSNIRAEWLFAGTVSNEKGDNYGYFFQIKSNAGTLHATALIVDAASQAVVFAEEGDSLALSQEADHWEVARAFLHFNPINESWIFGFKPTKDNAGFNFRVETLTPHASLQEAYHLSPTLTLTINQTGRLNGHMPFDTTSKEQFITGRTGWYWHLEEQSVSSAYPPLVGALCQLGDGGGLYAIHVTTNGVENASFAGQFDSQGHTVPVSQFVSILKNKAGLWRIQALVPKLALQFMPVLSTQNPRVGFSVAETEKDPAFCVVNATA